MQGGKKKNIFIHYLPVYGCISTGIIYAAIGTIAILSFLRIKDGGADENSLFAFLNHYLAGKILVVVILTGTLSYIIWRIYEAITDPYKYGKDLIGLTKRTGIALSTIADVLIAYAAISILLGNDTVQVDGQPDDQRQMVKQILQESGGSWIIVAIGSIVVLTAVVQLFYGISRGYKERLEVEDFSPITIKIVYILGWIGYFARGIILGIIGFFFIKAGILNDAQLIVNTDKAFDFIGDNIGHLYFILVAVGTICYGLFMFALGKSYDIDRD